MVLTFQQVKEDIHNYYINELIKNELIKKSIINAKMSQTYSDMPKGKGKTSDSGCNEVFRRLVLESRIKVIDEKMKYIDNAMCILDELERQTIEYIKKGYKMSKIANIIKCPRRKIVYATDRAIEKILKHSE